MVKDKIRDPSAWFSWRYPQANTMSSAEKQEIMCDNNCTWGQNISALRKSWLGFKIAKRKGETDELYYYANLIVSIQRILGIKETVFDDIPIDGID